MTLGDWLITAFISGAAACVVLAVWAAMSAAPAPDADEGIEHFREPPR